MAVVTGTFCRTMDTGHVAAPFVRPTSRRAGHNHAYGTKVTTLSEPYGRLKESAA